MYRALKPIYTPWGDVFTVTWAVLGIVESLEDAIRRFGGHPVLEEVK